MAKEIKDNTEEIRKNEKMVNISFNPKQVLKRLMIIILVIFWIISVAKPGLFKSVMSKVKEDKKVEVTTNKEIVMIERTSLYIALFDDSTFVSSDNLTGLAEKLSEATGKSFAAEGDKLKMIDGGMLTTVDIAVYRK